MLRFENVYKTYDEKSSPKTVLYNVSFELPDKGMVFILGKSGSGKSTILNLLGGLDKATKGSIYYGDKELNSLSNRERNSYRAHCVGFIFQEFFLFEKQTVKSNLLMMGQLLRKKYTAEQVSEILKAVDLAGYENKKCNLLSSGEKQRISIARSLIKDSKIILADEPTGSLDSENGERIFNILKKLSETRLVVVVSHDLEAAERYADYTIRIKDGEVIEKIGFTNGTRENISTFQVKKNYGLKISDAIKTAMSNIKQTWLRTMLSFVICFVGLTIFFVANIIATVDGPHRLVTALYENNVVNGLIEKKTEDFHQPKQRLTIEDVNSICKANSGLEFFKINTDYSGLFSSECFGIAEIPPYIAQEQKIKYGEIPSDLNSYFVTELYAERLLSEAAGKQGITDMESLIGYKVILYDKVFTLCGIVDNSELQNYYVYFNDGFLNSITDAYEKDKFEGLCSYLYFTMSGDFKTDYKFFKEYHGDNLYHKTNSQYVIRTAISDNFYSTMATYIGMSEWLYGISLVLMVFIILVCFNIISVAIRKNQKENGILRALGFSNFDLIKIYLLQMALPFILLIPLAGVAGYIIVKKINELLLSKLAVSFGLFAIGTVNVVWLLLLCVGIVIFSTFLPMIKLFREQPINVIKTH